jgi:hypothetical protein
VVAWLGVRSWFISTLIRKYRVPLTLLRALRAVTYALQLELYVWMYLSSVASALLRLLLGVPRYTLKKLEASSYLRGGGELSGKKTSGCHLFELWMALLKLQRAHHVMAARGWASKAGFDRLARCRPAGYSQLTGVIGLNQKFRLPELLRKRLQAAFPGGAMLPP